MGFISGEPSVPQNYQQKLDENFETIKSISDDKTLSNDKKQKQIQNILSKTFTELAHISKIGVKNTHELLENRLTEISTSHEDLKLGSLLRNAEKNYVGKGKEEISKILVKAGVLDKTEKPPSSTPHGTLLETQAELKKLELSRYKNEAELVTSIVSSTTFTSDRADTRSDETAAQILKDDYERKLKFKIYEPPFLYRRGETPNEFVCSFINPGTAKVEHVHIQISMDYSADQSAQFFCKWQPPEAEEPMRVPFSDFKFNGPTELGVLTIPTAPPLDASTVTDFESHQVSATRISTPPPSTRSKIATTDTTESIFLQKMKERRKHIEIEEPEEPEEVDEEIEEPEPPKKTTKKNDVEAG